MKESHKEIIRKVNETFNNNDTETFLSYCTDNVQWTMTGSAPMIGKEVIRKAMEMPGFTGMINTTKQIIADGDVIAVEGTIEMTKKTGDIHKAAYCDIYHMKNGKIYDMTSYVVDLK